MRPRSSAPAEEAPPIPASAEPPPPPLRIGPTDATGTELAQANAARHDWIAAGGRRDRTTLSPRSHRVADYLVNTSDPAATSLPLRDGVRMGYQAHDVVDGGPARIILTALVAPAEVADDAPALDVLWHARFRWRLRPQYAVADKGYATVAIIRRRDEQGLRADLSLPTSLAVVNQMPQCRSWLALAGRHGNNVGHV